MTRLKQRYILVALTVATTLSAFAAGNILSLKESITDDAIVFPESFETDTHEMMQNWYLQNYAVLDDEVESRATGDVSDAEYVRRLKAMPTEIEMPFNQVVKSYIEMYTHKRRTLVETMLGMSLYYMPIFEQALEEEGLPLELKYLPVIESALNPNAVSRAGAAGLWQFMIGTAKGVGLEVNSLVDERRDPYRSSAKAAKYLHSLYDIYHDWSLAIAAYNCGPGNVNKAMRRAGDGGAAVKDFWAIYPYLPKETRGYVPAFIAANYVMTYFKLHNISPSLAKRPLITDTVHVTRRIHLQQISDVLGLPIEEIRVLNPHFRKDVIPGNTHAYALSLPSQQVYSYIMSEDSIANYNASRYSPRDVVEPAGYSSGDDKAQYTYTTKTVTKYHKVRRGETLGKIASRYGVSQSNLRKWNGIGRKGGVQRGQTLKIVTTERVRHRVEPEEQGEHHSIAEADNDDTGDEDDADTGDDEEEEEEEVAPAKPEPAKAKPEPAKAAPKHESRKAEPAATTHKVKEGESLTIIANRYGVSIDDIKAANGISGDGNTILPGTKLTIPAKGSAKASKSSARTKHQQPKASSKKDGKSKSSAKAKRGSKSKGASKSTKSSKSKKGKKRRK